MSNFTETDKHSNPIELYKNRYYCEKCKFRIDKVADYKKPVCPYCGRKVWYVT